MRLISICVGLLTKKKHRHRAETIPQNLHKRPLYSPKVAVWYAISELEIWGPYFSVEKSHTITANTDRYCQLLVDLVDQNWMKLKIRGYRSGQLVTRHGVKLFNIFETSKKYVAR